MDVICPETICTLYHYYIFHFNEKWSLWEIIILSWCHTNIVSTLISPFSRCGYMGRFHSLFLYDFEEKYNCNTSLEESWNTFLRQHRCKTIRLDNELCNIAINSTVIDYCTRIMTILDLLDNINAIVPENNLVTYPINGIPQNFDYVSSLIFVIVIRVE